MSGHVFGDDVEAELREMSRVVKREGWILMCPGNNDEDNDTHDFLVRNGFSWAVFEEPGDGRKRRYWRREARL